MRLLVRLVDPGERLVEQQHLRSPGQGARHERASLLPTGELGHRLLAEILEADGSDRGAHRVLVTGPAASEHAGTGEATRPHQLVHGDRDRPGRGLALRHVADQGAISELGERLSEQLDRAGEAIDEPEHALQQGGLAGAVGTEQRHHFARPDREIGARGDVVVVAELTVADLDDRVAHVHP